MQEAAVLKVKLNTDDEAPFWHLSEQYASACTWISQYVFDHDFKLNSVNLSKSLYGDIRAIFGLKSQMAQSAIRTVTARYAAIGTQLEKKPYRIHADDGKTYSFPRDLFWLMKPVIFGRPQADLVRNRDYSFVDGGSTLSINTLDGRIRVPYIVPHAMRKYMDGTWKFGTGKLVNLKGIWYFHISVTKETAEFTRDDVQRVVGIDRGLRFLTTTYDSFGRTHFVSGGPILEKRQTFDDVRAELQAKGTKSAKRALKRVSGRENRWMSDVNHCISKALVRHYGPGTLFVLEDLEDVSTDERNFHSEKQTHDLRSWAFYDLENKLSYKAAQHGSGVLRVDAHYTSQRCPHCGSVLKSARDHKKHEYRCPKCGFRSNDDRVGAMNIHLLGTLWVTGIENPTFKPKGKK